MASNWNTVAESWLKGNVSAAEVVFEAAVEGQLAELLTFFQRHTALLEAAAPLSQEVLEGVTCQCAYFMLGTPARRDAAVYVIHHLLGDASARRWLHDAMVSTLDGAVRKGLMDYLNSHRMLNSAMASLLRSILRVEQHYTTESYVMAFERLKESDFVAFQLQALTQMEASLNALSPRQRGAGVIRLTDEVEGMAVQMTNFENVWEQLRIDPEWHARLNEWRMAITDRSAEGRSPLFFKGTVQWIQFVDEDSLHRIILEGELLSTYLERLGDTVSDAWEDSDARWKAEVHYCLARDLVEQALARLEDIPDSCATVSTLTVRQNGAEVLRYEGAVLRLDLVPLCTTHGRQMVEKKLLSKGLWLQTTWESAEAWIRLLAKSGVLFGTVPVHEDIRRFLRTERVALAVIDFCIHCYLPSVLQSYFENNCIPSDLETALPLMRGARGCDWAQWLILSCLPDQKFAASVANARAILAKQDLSVKSLSALTQAESIYVILTALAHSPRPLNETLVLESPVFAESPSQRQGLQVEGGMLCLVEPVCHISDIEPRLQENYPCTCQALHAIAQSRKERGNLTAAEYRQWRDALFRTKLESIGFMDLVMTGDIEEVEMLLEMSQLTKELPSDPTLNESAEFWEEKHLERIQQWIQERCEKDVPEGMSIGICHHIICGRPMAALQWFLSMRPATASVSFSKEDLRFLELLVRLVALWNYKEPGVVFSSLIFARACGIDASKIKVDVAAIQKLDALQGANVDVPALMEDLSAEIAMEYDDRMIFVGSSYVSNHILTLLENAILSSCSVRPLMSSNMSIDLETPHAVSQSTDAVLKWLLVHAFATLHKRTPSKRLLERFAQADDWILFLTEADFYKSSIDEVIQIARGYFSDPHLGHHVCYILQKSQTETADARSSFPLSASAPDRERNRPLPKAPLSEELLDILLEAEQTGEPTKVLLMWARRLKWRLLAVVAACYGSSLTYLECLVTWLDIGMAAEGSSSSHVQNSGASCWRPDAPRDVLIEELMHLVYQLCQKGDYDALLEGLSIFDLVPLQPIKHFLAALRYYTMHMFNATSQHLTAFEDSLLKEIKKSDAAKEQMASATSSNIGALLAVQFDLDLVDEITQSAVMSVLRSLSTPFERQRLLEILNRMEIDDGVSWLMRLRTIHKAYKLLGNLADSCIDWKSQSNTFEVAHLDSQQVLDLLQQEGKWMEARQWAFEYAMPIEDITHNQVALLVQEWQELQLDDELDDILWGQINEVFMAQEYPSLKAGLFFIQQAAKTEGASSKKLLLMEALQWIDGTKGQRLEAAPQLIEQLRRVLYLIDDDGDVIQQLSNKTIVPMGGRNEKCPAVQMVLRPVLETAAGRPGSERSRSSEVSLQSSPSFEIETARQTFRRADATLTKEEQQCLEILEQIIPKAADAQVQKAIKYLLDSGQIDAAESMQQSERLEAQIEFFLVNTALSIVQKCGSNGWNGDSAEKVVLVPILNFLEKKGCLDMSTDPSPQDVLDAVVVACTGCGGYPVCARAAVTFRAASLLNMSCVELATCGPNKALELLLLKGESASDVVRKFVSAFEFTPRATAKRVAQMYLNSLIGTRAISSIKEDEPIEEKESGSIQSNSADLINNSVICSDWVEIGNALMQLLVERHCVLPAEVEAKIMVQSYRCYERMDCVEGLNVLLDLATSRVRDFAANEKYDAMVTLTVGICKFDGLSAALDIIVQNKKLDLLFQDTNSHNPSTVSTLRSAILASIYRHSPKDSQTLNVTYRHFNMHVEVGQGMKDKAMMLLEQYAAAGHLSRDRRLNEAMNLLIRAGAEFSCAQCSVSAAACGALLALVAQQLCCNDRRWVSLTDSQCRALLPQLSDVNSALIVARAYKFNTPQDWILTLWQHMLHIAREYRTRLWSSLPLTRALQNLHRYASGIMKEITFSEEDLEQIMYLYVAFPTEGALYDKQIDYNVLTRCVIQFLRSISDVRQRWNLCQVMQGKDAHALMEECGIILDIECSRTQAPPPPLPQGNERPMASYS